MSFPNHIFIHLRIDILQTPLSQPNLPLAPTELPSTSNPSRHISMVKKTKWKYYGVRRIAGVRTEADGEVRFLVKWNGYSSLHDTWEPLINLHNVEEMLTEFLLKNGLSLGLMSGQAETLRQVSTPLVPTDIKADCNIPTRKADLLKFHNTDLPDNKRSSPDQQRFCPSLRLQPGVLERDRPVKIIGARGNDRSLEYAVLFAPSPDRFVGVGVVSHQEVVAKAPWLFVRFFLSSQSVVLLSL